MLQLTEAKGGGKKKEKQEVSMKKKVFAIINLDDKRVKER